MPSLEGVAGGRRSHERLRIRVHRIAEDLVLGTVLDQIAEIHDANGI